MAQYRITQQRPQDVRYRGTHAMIKIEIVREIGSIKNQLIEKYRPEKIILFGSAAWGPWGDVVAPVA